MHVCLLLVMYWYLSVTLYVTYVVYVIYASMLMQSFEAIVIISRLTVVMPRCWGGCPMGHQI